MSQGHPVSYRCPTAATGVSATGSIVDPERPRMEGKFQTLKTTGSLTRDSCFALLLALF